MYISKITATVFAAMTLLSCSCSDDSLVRFNHISDPEYTPADIDHWSTQVFVFSNGKCSLIQKFDRLSDIKYLDAAAGDRVAVVAMESTENTCFSSEGKGSAAETYILTTDDMSPTIPRTWAAVFDMEEGKSSVRTIMKPVTAGIEFAVINAPEAFQNATLTLEGLNNSWCMYDESYGIVGKSDSVVLTTEGEEKSLTSFTINEETGIWPPKLQISLKDEELNPELDFENTLTKGMHIRIEIDFSQYLTKGTYDVVCTYGDVLNPYSTKIGRQTFETAITAGAVKNSHYSVETRRENVWRTEEVHDALCSDADKHAGLWNDWTNSKQLRDTMSYCLLDCDFPARIRVRKLTGSFSKVEVRPSIYDIQVTDCGDNTIEFTLPSEAQGKVSVEFDDDRMHNLFIYARRPDKDKPSRNDPNVRYFERGEHNPGTIYLNDGQTLYIEHGAKVYANVKTSGNNITIAGHGILSGEKMVHKGDNLYSWGDFLVRCNTSSQNARNLTVKDITMIDSPGWNMIIPKTTGVVIDGVNMISWELNGDGIDIVSSQDVEIKNCFIRTYDDCLTLKCRFIVKPIIDVTDVSIHDCLIWADYARGIVVGPEAGNTEYSGRIHDIEVKDCIFLQHKRGLNDDQRSAFAIGQGSDGSTDLWSGTTPPTTMSDISASNLIFDKIDESGRNASIWQYGKTPVLMENITLKDFKVIDSYGNNYPAMYIKTNGSQIRNLKIENLTVNGTRITDTGSQFTIDKPKNVDYTIE